MASEDDTQLLAALVRRDAAEDVVQESWIKALAAIEGFEARASLRTWLAQIALNHARSRLRSTARERPLDEWGADPGSPIAHRFLPDGHWETHPSAGITTRRMNC